jgi:hypothetical protein
VPDKGVVERAAGKLVAAPEVDKEAVEWVPGKGVAEGAAGKLVVEPVQAVLIAIHNSRKKMLPVHWVAHIEGNYYLHPVGVVKPGQFWQRLLEPRRHCEDRNRNYRKRQIQPEQGYYNSDKQWLTWKLPPSDDKNFIDFQSVSLFDNAFFEQLLDQPDQPVQFAELAG